MVNGQVGTERFVSQWGAPTHRTDVVIATAIRLEFDAVLAVDAGAVPGSAWETIAGPSGISVAFRSFTPLDAGTSKLRKRKFSAGGTG